MLPAAGQYFARVAGVDDTIQLYELSLTPTPILLGDYNKDGRVDGADYVVWRNTQGQSVAQGAGADGSFDGQITAADYNVWRSHFGQTLGTGSGSGSGGELFGATSAVPEQASIWLVVLAAAAVQVFAVRRRNR